MGARAIANSGFVYMIYTHTHTHRHIVIGADGVCGGGGGGGSSNASVPLVSGPSDRSEYNNIVY